MTELTLTNCKYIVWVDYGPDGYHPRPCYSWNDALKVALEGGSFTIPIITRAALEIPEPREDE